MSKIKRLKKRFAAFVNQLTPDQVREQLILAYLQMERCMQVLRGADVEPVSMMDNGESSDLELFYMCKKAAEELAYLNEMAHEGKKVGTLELEVEIDTHEFEKELDSLCECLAPRVFDFETFLRFKGGLPKISERFLKRDRSGFLFEKGQEVWYMFGDRIQHSTIEYPMRDVDGVTIYKTKLGHSTAECETFGSLEELLENLKKTINGK